MHWVGAYIHLEVQFCPLFESLICLNDFEGQILRRVTADGFYRSALNPARSARRKVSVQRAHNSHCTGARDSVLPLTLSGDA